MDIGAVVPTTPLFSLPVEALGGGGCLENTHCPLQTWPSVTLIRAAVPDVTSLIGLISKPQVHGTLTSVCLRHNSIAIQFCSRVFSTRLPSATVQSQEIWTIWTVCGMSH